MNKGSRFNATIKIVLFLIVSLPLNGFGQTYFSEPVVTEDKALLEEARIKFTASSNVAREKYSSKVFAIYYKNSLERVRGFREMLESGQLLYSGVLFEEVNALFEEIKKSNPELDSSLRLFIYRTDEPNAFSTGDGMIFVNLGLIYRCQNHQQLAWVLAHEIAHNELKHFDQKIIDYADVVLSEELKEELKKLRRVRYHHATAFYELMLPQLLARSSQSRVYETQADSLGSIYYNNTAWSLNEALGVFPVMESFEDEIWSTPLNLNQFFNPADVDAISKRIPSQKKASAFDIFKTVGEEEDTISELITRTHPFPMERFNLLLELNHIDSLKVEIKMSDEYERIKSMSRHEIIVHLLRTDQIDKAMYHSMRHLLIDSTSKFDIRVISYSLGLTIFAKDRMLFNDYISVQSPYEGDNFNAYTKFLWECSIEELRRLEVNWTEKHRSVLSDDQWGVTRAMSGLIFRDYDQFDKGLIVQKSQRGQDYIFYSLINDLGERMRSIRTRDER